MKTLKHFFIVVTVLLVFLRVSAQDTYRAVHWDIDQGLPSHEAEYMLKDVNGFLWISTYYGLSRFDGNTFKNYYNDKNKSKSISDNHALGLVEDSLHDIWIGTNKGLSRYDIKADTFTHLVSLLPGISSPSFIDPFWSTKDEVLCIEPKFTITSYNIHSFTKKIIARVPENLQLNDNARSIAFDAKSNSIWILEGYIGEPGGGLFEMSLSDGKQYHFTWSCYKKNHPHEAQGLHFDTKRNCIWINSNDGLMQFTLNDKRFHHIDALNKYIDPGNYGRGVGIDVDKEGKVWLATYPKGIIIYDPSNQSVQLPFPGDSLQQDEVSNGNNVIYCDNNEMVWSGFWLAKGIYQIIPFSPAVTRYTSDSKRLYSLSNNEVYNCINGPGGKVWIGTSEGLNIFDPQTRSFKVLYKKDLPGMVEKRILPISIDTISQKAWLSDHEIPVLYEMDMRTKKCRPIIFKDSANHAVTNINFIFSKKYKGGCVIVAFCEDQQRIFIVNSDSLVARQILSFPKETINELNTSDDYRLLFLRRVNGKNNFTYSNLNGKWVQIPNALDNIYWRSITFSQTDQTYWVVADRDIIHYNKDFSLIRHYTQEDGLPGFQIYNLITDNNGNVWFNIDRLFHSLKYKQE